jgi:uncharacterized protein YbbC (DUF1343 family)
VSQEILVYSDAAYTWLVRPPMLFKTLSASVYGIDAYLVEVEVDVGSAYFKNFNVVGLPDNAVRKTANVSSPRCATAVTNFRMSRA